ncbi:MAG: peptidase domain-containing ABC transporter [Treponema sp.]|nr:peptidase domain-containing ABC transporter [Treponema sp.]
MKKYLTIYIYIVVQQKKLEFMHRIKKVLQHDETDCGAACISIILKYYGKSVPLRRIRTAAGTDSVGTSGYGIVKGAEKFGMSCKGLMSPEKDKIDEIPLPAIFHIKQKFDHYVVVYKVSKKYVYISDPGEGLRKVNRSEFFSWWTGVFFILFPTSDFEKGNENRGLLFRFVYLLKPYKLLVSEILIASLLLSLFGVFVSFYFRFLIDEVLYSQVKSTLNLCSICYLIVIVFQTLIEYCRSQIILHLGTKIDVSLLSDFFCHLLHLPLNFFSSRKTGEILSRINDAETVKNAISSTTLGIIMDSFMLVVGGFFLFKLGMNLLPIAIVPVILSAIVVWIYSAPFKRKIKMRSILEADKNASMYESINGISTIKGLSTEDKAYIRVEEKIVMAADKALELGKLGNCQRAIQDFISGTGTLALYWFGSFMIFDGKLTLGQLISFNTLSGFFLGPLKRLLTMQLHLQEVMISAERLTDIIDMEEECPDEEKLEDIEKLEGDIEFKNVTFSYGTRGRAVEDVSFKIPAGKKVAFVGSSGSGKTTLLKLLMKFYPLEEGQILINGTDISEIKTSSYREKIGYVPQESLLFSGTISENIAWGCDNPDPKKIVASSMASQSYDFIQRLPEKFNTYVGEHGSTLSGGERQRLAMARILMRNPHMLILDEATASLDSISEQAIMDTIFTRIQGRTVIMVAHRLSTIKDCDLIYVFNKGKLVEQGSHFELLAKNGFYKSLWRAQNEKSNGGATPKYNGLLKRISAIESSLRN